MTKQRSSISDSSKWNIEKMYPVEENWESDYQKVLEMAEEFSKFAGNFTADADSLLKALKARDEIWRLAEHIYVYARMKRDEDNTVSKYQAMADRSQTLLSMVAAASSFFTPELLALPEGTIDDYTATQPALKDYSYLLAHTLRQKPHVLSQEEEMLMARMGEVLGSTSDIFTMINDADMKFGRVKNEKGEEVEVTHGNYIKFMESKNRDVRKAAYETLYSSFIRQKNTLATTYSYNTKTDAVLSKIRNYSSSLEHALFGDNVGKDVYTNLIDTVNANLDTLHKYMGTRKRLLGFDKLNMYDVYVPLVEIGEKDIAFEEAVEIMKTSLAPLGEEYVNQAVLGATEGWIDIYENEGKSSGAYSFGSYDSDPYILLNYSGKLKDVFTLVHEMGHSMHSYYTRKTQPFIYGSHSIFTAEVASTVNESLLINHLLGGDLSKDERAYFLNFYIEEFRTTLFRQTMFAEFEMMTHDTVERGDVLTCESLSEMYGALNEKYFGSDVETDDFIRMEWSRIPHFYRAFYVYKYATGFSAATALANRILTEGKPAVDDYLAFLKTGDSDDPIELLKIAGVDMGQPKPIEDAMVVFSKLVEEFDRATK